MSSLQPPSKRQAVHTESGVALQREPFYLPIEEVAARNLHDQVENLVAGLTAWSLDGLAERRRRAFGSASSPAVKKLQHRAITQLLRSSQEAGPRSPPRPTGGRTSRKLNPVRQHTGPAAEGHQASADPFMSPPVKRNYVLLAQPHVMHSPLDVSDFMAASQGGSLGSAGASHGEEQEGDRERGSGLHAGRRREAPSVPLFSSAALLGEHTDGGAAHPSGHGLFSNDTTRPPSLPAPLGPHSLSLFLSMPHHRPYMGLSSGCEGGASMDVNEHWPTSAELTSAALHRKGSPLSSPGSSPHSTSGSSGCVPGAVQGPVGYSLSLAAQALSRPVSPALQLGRRKRTWSDLGHPQPLIGSIGGGLQPS